MSNRKSSIQHAHPYFLVNPSWNVGHCVEDWKTEEDNYVAYHNRHRAVTGPGHGLLNLEWDSVEVRLELRDHLP